MNYPTTRRQQKSTPTTNNFSFGNFGRKVWKRLKTFTKILAIFIIIVMIFKGGFDLFVRIEVTKFFGDQPIMDKNLLGMKLVGQSFNSGKYTLFDMGKPTSYSMSNYFETPTDVELTSFFEQIINKAKEYGWKFNDYKDSYETDGGGFSIIGYGEQERSIFIYILPANSKFTYEICISIESESKNWH